MSLSCLREGRSLISVLKSRLVRVENLSRVSKANTVSGFGGANGFDCMAED